MSRCDRVHEELKAYQDRELGPLARTTVALHLRGCPTCREEIQTMSRLSALLRSQPADTLPTALRDRIVEAMPTGLPDAPPTRPRRTRVQLLWASGAVGVVLLAASMPLLTSTFSPRRETAGLAQRHDPSPNFGPQSAGSPARENVGAAASEQTPASTATGPVYVDGKLSSAGSSYTENRMQEANGRSSTRSSTAGTDSYADARHAVPAASPTAATTPPLYNAKKAIVGGLASSPAAAAFDPERERQVHREGSLTVQTAKVEEASDLATRVVRDAQGYVAQNELSTGDDNLKTAILTLKVPVSGFEPVMAKLAKLGSVTARALSGEDITDKLTDEQESERILGEDVRSTEASLRTRRSAGQGRHDEEALRSLRIRLAQSQARLKTLQRLGSLSTITLQISEPPKPAPAAGGLTDEFGDTLRDAAHSFQQALRLPLQMLVWVIVYAPIWGLLLFGYRRASRI